MALQLEAQSPVSYSHVTLPLCKVTGVGGPFWGAGLYLNNIKQLHVSAHEILVLMEYGKPVYNGLSHQNQKMYLRPIIA